MTSRIEHGGFGRDRRFCQLHKLVTHVAIGDCRTSLGDRRTSIVDRQESETCPIDDGRSPIADASSIDYNRGSVSTRDLLDDCVHCGFCLPTCPTYLLWGQETDSPRGRIHLMKLRRDGRESNPQSFVEHIDTCLGCMACVTACPSGVQYDSLLEAARPEVE